MWPAKPNWRKGLGPEEIKCARGVAKRDLVESMGRREILKENMEAAPIEQNKKEMGQRDGEIMEPRERKTK